MKKVISITLIIVIILMAFPFTAFGQEKTSISQYIDKTLSDMVDQKKVKGVIVSVVGDGKNELCKGYGFADEAEGIASHEDNTAFHIGSLSKTFVAVAAQQLVQSGKLDMNASVADYLEADFPKFKYDITMHDLLTFTAGFEDMFSGIAVNEISKVEPLALSIRKYMPKQVFVPGEVVSYSNYSIVLAAYVVQCISKQDFITYTEENIFKPLGMTKTSFEVDYKGAKVSKAYAINGEEAFEPFVNLYPEGSVVSTAADMSRYMKWLMDGSDKVLNVKAKHELFQQHFTMSNEFEGMGYVWSRQKQNGVYYYHRKGETINFYSRIVIYPELNTGVFISFNTYVNEKKLDEMMEEITNSLLGQREQKSVYTGAQTEDISGYYISTRSNFTSQEKILNFITPDRVFRITGSAANGFLMNGTKLLPIGKNYYSTPIGDLKYIEGKGRVYLANKTATSFVSTNWYESCLVQVLIISISLVLSLILTIIGASALFRKKGSIRHYFPSVLSAINIALFIGICILSMSGASNFNMLNPAPFVRICGILIVVTSLSGILYTLYSFKKKIFTAQSILLIAWNISSILFCLWMLQVNILL